MKGSKHGYLTAALFMTPHRVEEGGRVTNVCPYEDNCARDCIAHTGMGTTPSVRYSRAERRRWFDEDPKGFIERLEHELEAFSTRAYNRDLLPAARLNATSDIRWELEAEGLFMDFADIQFYDYTKWPIGLKHARRGKPKEFRRPIRNYYLVRSWSPKMDMNELRGVLSAGVSVAAPFAPLEKTEDKNQIPKEYLGIPVVNGDTHDLIFKHPPGTFIGLRFKGRGGSRPTWAEGTFALPF